MLKICAYSWCILASCKEVPWRRWKLRRCIESLKRRITWLLRRREYTQYQRPQTSHTAQTWVITNMKETFKMWRFIFRGTILIIFVHNWLESFSCMTLQIHHNWLANKFPSYRDSQNHDHLCSFPDFSPRILRNMLL